MLRSPLEVLRNSDCDWRSPEVGEAALLPVIPNSWRSGKLEQGLLPRSNFLTLPGPARSPSGAKMEP